MDDDNLTITGLDPVLRAALEAEAAIQGVSLNELILNTLSSSLGLAGSTQLFRDLNHFVDFPPLEGMEEFEAAKRYLEEIGGGP